MGWSKLQSFQDDEGNVFANTTDTNTPTFSPLTFGDFQTATVNVAYELNLPTQHLSGTGVNWFWTILSDPSDSITLNNYELDGSDPTAGTTYNLVTFDIPDLTTEYEIQLGIRAQLTPFTTLDVDGFPTCGIVENWPGDLDGDGVMDFYPITVNLTNDVIWGCRDVYADNYDETATIDNGDCLYVQGTSDLIQNGEICIDLNASNYFCNLYPLAYPCAGTQYDGDEDTNIGPEQYTLSNLIPTDVCDCKFAPLPSFTVRDSVNAIEIDEVNERETIILRNNSTTVQPHPLSNGFYNDYVTECNIENTFFSFSFDDTDEQNFPNLETNISEDLFLDIPTFVDANKQYGGGGEIDINLSVTNSIELTSTTTTPFTLVVNDIDLPPLIDYPDIYLRGGREYQVVGITLLTEEINQYDINELLLNSYYNEDGTELQDYQILDEVFFKFGDVETPTRAVYTESSTEGTCAGDGFDVDGNVVPMGTPCNPVFELFTNENCGTVATPGTCNPIVQWVLSGNVENTNILSPGQGLVFRVENPGILRWGVE